MKIAIQGELGSNSHMAALAMLGEEGYEIEIIACSVSAEVFSRLKSGEADAAVLPIENSLHGSVAEHYDLLLAEPVRIARESLLRVRHNVIAMPGVKIEEIRKVMSHPVALSQCRSWLAAHPEIEAVNTYDTAGSVKQVMAAHLRDTAGIAPILAAEQYGAEIAIEGIEDHVENYTRFFLLLRESASGGLAGMGGIQANKASVAFSVAHHPGTLVRALEEFAGSGVNLTKIESRPVPGMPWEYVFFVDLRFEAPEQIDHALIGLARHSEMVKELGRYGAA